MRETNPEETDKRLRELIAQLLVTWQLQHEALEHIEEIVAKSVDAKRTTRELGPGWRWRKGEMYEVARRHSARSNEHGPLTAKAARSESTGRPATIKKALKKVSRGGSGGH